jgi:hypothetical protein
VGTNGPTYTTPALTTETSYWVLVSNAYGTAASTTATVSLSVQDTTAPTVTITSPTAEPSFTTSASSVTLAGTASDNVGVVVVSWVSSRGGGGTAAGTVTWSVPSIPLQRGTNRITVTAQDAVGLTQSDVLTVNRR